MATLQPLDRRDFLKGLLGGTAAVTLGLGLVPPIVEGQASGKGNPFNVRDFGAQGDGKTDDLAAFNAALGQVNAAGGGSLYIPSGIYMLSGSVNLIGKTTVYGNGMGATVLMLADGVTQDVVGLVRTLDIADIPDVSQVMISDLTLDGNRAKQTSGEHYGFYCGTDIEGSRQHQIGCWRVEVRNFRGYGFDPHERTERVSIIECISHDNGRDGITLDHVLDGVVRSCVSFNNDRHGFNLITASGNVVIDQCISHNNGANGFTIQNESSDVQITTSIAYANHTDGIYCVDVNDNMITNNQVYLNLENGIRIRGCARTTVTGNRLRDNSQSEHDRFSEIILDNDDINPTIDTAVIANHVTCTGDVRARYGIRETPGEGSLLQARNAFIANKVSGGSTSDYGLSSDSSFRDLGA